MSLSETVASSFVNYFEMLRGRIRELVSAVPDQDLWRRPYTYGNSIGNLMLHLIGNLSYYIGARMAETGYVRDRDREFTTPDGPSKEEILARWDKTIDMVIAALRRQTAEDWQAAFSAERADGIHDRFSMWLRCAGHGSHHLGQLIYLQKELEAGK
jgi:hypothetical protein